MTGANPDWSPVIAGWSPSIADWYSAAASPEPGSVIVEVRLAATIEVTVTAAGITCSASAPSVQVSAHPVGCQ